MARNIDSPVENFKLQDKVAFFFFFFFALYRNYVILIF